MVKSPNVALLVILATACFLLPQDLLAKRKKCSDPQVFCQGVPGGKCWVGDYGRTRKGGKTTIETDAVGTVTKNGKKCKYKKQKNEIAGRPDLNLFDIANEMFEPPEAQANPASAPPSRAWNLGSLEAGKVYPTSITAQNISCPGEHTFLVELEDNEWLAVPGDRSLKNLGIGRRQTTEALVDLRGVDPGTYRATILILCTTCPPPPKCTQNITRLEAVVEVTKGGEEQVH